MGLIDNKKTVINNVALFEVLNTLPRGRVTSSLASVNSTSKNLLPFLIDLLSVTCNDNKRNPKSKSKCDTVNILVSILTKFYPTLIRILKEGFISGIKAGLACGVDFTIPSPAPSVTLSIKKIDFNDLLKIDPTTEMGSMFYGKNATTDLNWFLYDLIQSGGFSSWKNILDFTYYPVTQEIKIQVNASYVGKSFNQFLLDFINSTELLTLENMLSKIIDQLTGSIGSNLPNVNLSVDKLISLGKINKLQDKILNSTSDTQEYQLDNSFFVFTNSELFEIETEANQKYIGTTVLDLGCGVQESTVSPEISKSLFDTIRNTPPSKIEDIMTQSINILNDQLTSNVDNKDKKVAKDSLNVKIIQDIPKIFTSIILEPKIVVLYQISSKIVNDIFVNVTDSFDYVKACKTFFEYVVKESLSALIKTLYEEIKRQILSLVGEIAIKIIKEQAELRIKSITSIVSGSVGVGLSPSIPSVKA